MLTTRSGELESAEANVVEGFIVEHHALVSILDQLVNGERGVVRLDDRVGDLRGGEDGEGEHHAVRVLLPYLRDEQRAHAGSRSAA